MRTHPRSILVLAAALSLGACGDDPKSEGPRKPGAAGPGAVTLGAKMPEYTPSGIKEDYKKVSELKSEGIKHAKTDDQRKASQKAMSDLLAELTAKWAGKDVPAPEGFLYAYILKEAEKWPEAVTQLRRFIEVAPPDSVNYPHAVTMLVHCLAASGDYDGAQAEITKAADTTFKNRDTERAGAEQAIAQFMMKAGLLERAAAHFETLISLGGGDQESAIYGVDCWLRLGRTDEALRVAQKGLDFFKEGRAGDRMKDLVAATSLVGKPSPDFSAVRDWKGEGGPITKDMMAGKVTVVFFWNMQAQWIKFFFERVNAMNDELAPKGMILVGCSRLAHIDANKMVTRKDMTEEEELVFYDAWTQEYKVHYPLAVGNYDPDTALTDAWAAHVIPSFIVVGKDGKVCYTRTGKADEHIAILKEEVLKAMAK